MHSGEGDDTRYLLLAPGAEAPVSAHSVPLPSPPAAVPAPPAPNGARRDVRHHELDRVETLADLALRSADRHREAGDLSRALTSTSRAPSAFATRAIRLRREIEALEGRNDT